MGLEHRERVVIVIEKGCLSRAERLMIKRMKQNNIDKTYTINRENKAALEK